MSDHETPDFSDIQGLVVRGYGQLTSAAFLLLSIRNRSKARPWLEGQIEQLTFAQSRPGASAVNLAFTHHGLVRLGIHESVLAGFSNEFRSGMITPHKRRILGDEGHHAPEHWLWGGPDTDPVDVLMLCYADSEEHLDGLMDGLMAGLSAQGLETLHRLDSFSLPEFREHFGFRDGIGQPHIAEFDSDGLPRGDSVPLGEFVLGYPNGYGLLTPRPLLEPDQDRRNLLSPAPEDPGARDLGLNGSYLVFRQLAQDVGGFWRTLRSLTAAPDSPIKDPVHLAAKMVGRWPSGASLVVAPDQDDPAIRDKDDFRYHEHDADGSRCPLGAHVRRTHPRDSLEPEPGTDKSFSFSNRHRLLRRGRTYGSAFAPGLDPTEILNRLHQDEPSDERGLHFICLNGNIGRQFEFVQHTWADNPNFNGLRRETDPVIGHRIVFGEPQDSFRVQRVPLRYKYRRLPEFITTRGGGYFFLPSRRALQFLLSE